MSRGWRARRLFARLLRSGVPLWLVIVAVLSSSTVSAAGEVSGSNAASSAPLTARSVLLAKGAFVASIATDAHYLTWEVAASRGQPLSPLFERKLRGGPVKRLATRTLPEFGLASTATNVVYAEQGKSGPELVAIRHGGRHRIVLTRSLAAPIASRGNRVAWAEQTGSTQRVVVRDMTSRRVWIAAQMRRCDRIGCYRIDAVTLADEGVVFDRGAIGPQPSFIVRRRFRDRKPAIVKLPNDPQPDLARSSAGAYYYWLRHGWMRWNFGEGHHHATGRQGLHSWVLDNEHGSLLLQTGPSCKPRLEIQLPSGRTLVAAAPNSTRASPKNFGPLCRELNAFVWQPPRLLIAWSLIPKLSVQSHTDVGLVSVISELSTPGVAG
jgi:hypothetical protein